MKLPEWRPMPRHWINDNDSKDFMAALGLIVPVVLLILGAGLLFVGLLVR